MCQPPGVHEIINRPLSISIDDIESDVEEIGDVILVRGRQALSCARTRDYVAQGVRRSQGLEPPEHLEHANRSWAPRDDSGSPPWPT